MRIKRLAMNAFAVTVLLALFVLLMILGRWQLDRAQYKTTVIEDINRVQTSMLFSLPSAKKISSYQAQPLTLTGNLDFSSSMLLDNKVVNGVVGYEVLVPLVLEYEHTINDDGQLILVNLGWIAGTSRRDQLPILRQWSEINEVVGYLYQPTTNPFVSSTIYLNSSQLYPMVIPSINFKKMEMMLNQKVYPAIVRLHEQSTWGYLKRWQWHNNMTPQKHRAYALQWFALACTLLILSSYFIWKLNKKSSHDDST